MTQRNKMILIVVIVTIAILAVYLSDSDQATTVKLFLRRLIRLL